MPRACYELAASRASRKQAPEDQFEADFGLISGSSSAVLRLAAARQVHNTLYKTDRVSPTARVARAEHYRLQAEAYARALRNGLGLHASRIEFIMVAAGRDQAEVFAVEWATCKQ